MSTLIRKAISYLHGICYRARLRLSTAYFQGCFYLTCPSSLSVLLPSTLYEGSSTTFFHRMIQGANGRPSRHAAPHAAILEAKEFHAVYRRQKVTWDWFEGRRDVVAKVTFTNISMKRINSRREHRIRRWEEAIGKGLGFLHKPVHFDIRNQFVMWLWHDFCVTRTVTHSIWSPTIVDLPYLDARS